MLNSNYSILINDIFKVYYPFFKFDRKNSWQLALAIGLLLTNLGKSYLLNILNASVGQLFSTFTSPILLPTDLLKMVGQYLLILIAQGIFLALIFFYEVK